MSILSRAISSLSVLIDRWLFVGSSVRKLAKTVNHRSGLFRSCQQNFDWFFHRLFKPSIWFKSNIPLASLFWWWRSSKWRSKGEVWFYSWMQVHVYNSYATWNQRKARTVHAEWRRTSLAPPFVQLPDRQNSIFVFTQ